MERQSMGLSDDIQIKGGQVNTPASDEGRGPMVERLAEFDSSVLNKNRDFPKHGRRNDDQCTICKGGIENLCDTRRKV